ncbi:MAG TPA: ABC transporter ATP-binding protein [Candidatus Paceibacterota bacterium]|nr:ABC transporter ATP-binding protein [Verrucomicrobiota bacterium]HRY50814.1 ABC transporter ATP-binding protein [Candidatus Paceibacterota bacterium]
MKVFWRRLWIYLVPYRFRFLLGCVFGILCAASNGALMLNVKVAVNLVVARLGGEQKALVAEGQEPDWIQAWAFAIEKWFSGLQLEQSQWAVLLSILLIPVIMAARGVCTYLNVYFMNWAAFRAVADLRQHLFDHLQNLSLGFFSRASTGELISRISNDTTVLQNVIRVSVASIVRDPFTIVVMLGILLSQHMKLTLISLIVFPVLLVPIRIYARKVRRAVRAMQELNADLTSLMHEDFTCNRIIKAYNLESNLLARFKETTRQYVKHAMRLVRSHEMPGVLSEFFGALGVALVLIYALWNDDKSMKAGDFIQFAGSIFLMYQPIKALSRLHNQMAQGSAAGQRIFELLDVRNLVVDPPQPVALKADGAPIHFENVHFRYDEKPVLRGFSLTINPGQVCALVGSSGSGKTTVANLLLRFYDPEQGCIRIGSTDLRQVRLADLRSQIAVVTQETFLFNDTVIQNIAVGNPQATEAEIERAAQRALAHGFVTEKPQGYRSVIGEKGLALSGGQRQRIAIARAILKNAPILILDEATSALDTESERLVQQALDELMQGRTTLCIAHRLSTIQNADLIVVMDQGRIVETGRHEELLDKGGVYQRLYELQFQPV